MFRGSLVILDAPLILAYLDSVLGGNVVGPAMPYGDAIRQAVASGDLPAAPQGAFTTGEFLLVTEAIPGCEAPKTGRITSPPRCQTTARRPGELAHLEICRGCERHVLAEEVVCPFCSADIAMARRQFDSDRQRRLGMVARLEVLLREADGLVAPPPDAGEML